ncbi:hypothetical protein BU17DRAFT_67872 [Hysterangium stoloniferum]|nr:hypothetical protein BU17DRAFT_67872 [Hysterangium stoloniferum]
MDKCVVPPAPSRRRTIPLPKIDNYETSQDDFRCECGEHCVFPRTPSPSPGPPRQPMLSAVFLDPAFETLVYDFKSPPQTAFITGGRTQRFLASEATFPSLSQMSVDIIGISSARYTCEIFQGGGHITIGDFLAHIHRFLHQEINAQAGRVMFPSEYDNPPKGAKRVIDLLEDRTRFDMLSRDQNDPNGIHWYLETAVCDGD